MPERWRGLAADLDGGAGLDFATYLHSAARVVVDLQSGTGHGGDAEGDTLISLEGLQGSDFSDILSGNGANNDIRGGLGNDVINGRGGNDVIEGDGGNDVLTGGSGRDTFVFFSSASSTSTDHITDFNVNEDHIDFHAAAGESVSINVGNFNFATMTASVDVTLGHSGHVVLDNISLGDLSHVAQAIDVV